MTIRFDGAFDAALALIRAAPVELSGAGKVVVTRDFYGRVRLVVQHRTDLLDALAERMAMLTGRYHGGPVLVESEMVAPATIFQSPDLYKLGGVDVLERGLIGADWTRAPLPNAEPCPPRAVLHGIKGGVGRSTALIAWSRHLALRGERVLVIDLDLESPGISSTLLPPGSIDAGVIDWLVEDANDNADDELVRSMVVDSPLAGSTSGSILVAPCGLSGGASYLAKLSRAYIDVPSRGEEGGFAWRLARMVDQLELIHRPSVVLIDARAGLHDLAAVALTRLDAMNFLFAMGTRQTWDGYSTLFKAWSAHRSTAADVRQRLKIVASHIPETNRADYLTKLTADAYATFEPMYDEVGDELDAFNFDIDASDAPHFPLPIYWSGEFQDWDPLARDVTPDQLRATFGEFVEQATSLLEFTQDEDAEA